MAAGKKKKGTPQKKGKGRKRALTPIDNKSSSNGSTKGDESKEVKIDWKDADLTWLVISASTDDATIKQGLFPSPGANVSTSKGGGKPKTDHQFALAVALFSEHPKYCEVFKWATSSKEKTVWAKWIKNCLQKTANLPNEVHELKQDFIWCLTDPQELIKESFQWLWEMKELISKCPNIIPVGIGNNASDIDMSGYVNVFNSSISNESSQLARARNETESKHEEDNNHNDAPTNRGDVKLMG
ncbi:hypothetical protein BJV74DRAFT_797146 [Russula compacta]|nr:hypothetical protein BJV74DRAFT_797146 [Russula compacta]